MRKIYLLLLTFIIFYKGYAQVLNQSASWPNPAWTITGSYATGATAFESNPTTTANFAFDDDDAGNNHNDDIAAVSPVIDLTAAHTAGENFISITVDYGFRRNQLALTDVLKFEYWNADTSTWVPWGGNLPDTYFPLTTIADNFCTLPKVALILDAISIANFTPTQLAGFKYRIHYDDNPAGNGWQWGFCFTSPTIKSSSAGCQKPTATFTMNSLCSGGSDEFQIVTNVTSLGTATSVTVSDDQGNSQIVSATGNVTFGPYANNTAVIVTVSNNQVTDCQIVSSALNQLICPPDNDSCLTAFELSLNSDYTCASVTPGTLAGATGSALTGDSCFGNANDDVWFSFEATATSHRISILNVTPYTDMYHSLWTGGCNALTLVANSCSDADVSNPTGLVPGQMYYVRVYSYGAGASTSTFNVCIGTPPPPPANDTCANAIDLTNETSPLQATTVGANNDNVNTCVTAGPITTNAYPDVYYFITVPNGSTLKIGQTLNDYDSSNVVFYGDCTNRTNIACFDDADYTQVTWANNTGSSKNVYWIQDGHSGSGTFTLEWSVIACTQPVATFTVNSLCSTGNDEFEIVTNITSLGSATSVTVFDDQGNSQTVSATGPVVLGPYSNSTPVIVTVENNQDPDCNIVSSALNQTACPPDNDSCLSASALTVNSDFACGSVTPGTLAGATGSALTGDTCFGNANDDVWFSFVATSTSHKISILNVAPYTDMYHSLWTGSCNGLTLVANSCSDGDSSDPAGLVAGQMYYVRVYSYGSGASTSTFNVCIGTPPPPPANDNFANAIAVSCGNTYTGSTVMATLDEDSAPDGGGADLDGRNVWYSYTGSGTPQTVTLSFCESDYDTSVLVYTGTSGNLTFVAANDDGYACGTDLDSRSFLNFESNGTTTYYITVEGWNLSNSGNYSMDVSCAAVIPPAVANQTCALALSVPTNGTSINSDNSYGTVNPVQPSCDTFGSIQDVWFSFVAPASGSVECAIDNNTMTSVNFNIYSGTCSALTPVSGTCNANLSTGGSEDLTGLVAGNTYFVQVWSSASEQGTFSITVTDEQLGVANPDVANFKAYPNPVKDILNLSGLQDVSKIEVFNLLGQQVISQEINTNEGKVNMSNLSSGTYIVKVDSNQQKQTFKIIKE